MISKTKIKVAQSPSALLAILLVALSLPVQAHSGHGAEGLLAGFAHPFMGLDHLLAMVAVGLWSSAVLPKAWRMAGPAVFLGMLLVGALVAVSGLVLPQVEPVVAASVAALGALLLVARRAGVVAGLTLVAVAAVFHGFAHGTEMATGQTFVAYAAGFMLGSAALHGLGLVAGRALQHLPVAAGRTVSAVLAACGLVILATRV